MTLDVAAGISLTNNLFQFLNFLREVVGAGVISSYHKYDGTQVEGAKQIEIELIPTGNKEVFYFTVMPQSDYVFVRFPLNSSGCEEEIATRKGQISPDPNIWRWIQSAQSGTIVGGQDRPPTAKVDFVVVGYRPKALIKHLTSTA